MQMHPGDFLLTQSWSHLVTSFLSCDIGARKVNYFNENHGLVCNKEMLDLDLAY